MAERVRQPTSGEPRAKGATARLLPRPTKGPFSLDLDALFDQASAAVRGRAEIVAQLGELQNPPDLGVIITSQRDVLIAGIAEQVARCLGRAGRLHELLVLQLASDRSKVMELEGLVDWAASLDDAIKKFNPDEPATWHELRQHRLRVERWRTVPGRPDPPEDPAAAMEAELAECRRLLAEIESQELDLLTTGLPVAREQLEFRAMVTEWESLRRDIALSLESAMHQVALTALNTARAEEAAPRMCVTSFDNLRQSLTNEQIVITDTYEHLEGMIRERHEGSFGIAGPRGVGKSTLINFFATTKGVRDLGGEEKTESFTEDEKYELTTWNRPRLGVVVSAPVAYEPREFVLHLYAELCKRVLGDDGDAAIRRQRELDPEPGFYGVPLRRAQGGLAALGAAALTGGLGLLILAIIHRLPWRWHLIADAGAALITIAVSALIWVLLQRGVLRPVFDRGIRMRLSHHGRTWTVAAVSALTVAGLTLLLTGGGWSGGTEPFLAAAALLCIGIPALRAARVAHDLASMHGPAIEDQPLSPDARLRELAFDHLRQIRYQQSFTRERSMAMKIGGAGLPAGVDAGGKRGQTWQERPKGYPELVSDLRAFLATVAEWHTLVVGVDELDKLRSPEDVERFLNDIKGIFGAAGCFFLVSVSEDAAASFERRGTPFRDVFDSAFDDVISVRQLDMMSARKVLYGLLLGWTKPFTGLCYVLSGGLARDLRRSARELITYRDQGGEIELATAALGMCRREGEARLRAIRHELMRNPFDAANVELLTRIADFTPGSATAPTMYRWHEQLSGWADAQAPAGRLGLELAAYLLLAATVIEFFDPAVIADRMGPAENPDAGPKCLTTLAMARQSLALSPGISLAYTLRFRAAWNLATV
jgi:hypothetical protein